MPPSGMMLEKTCSPDPFSSSPNHWKMKLIPTATINDASRGAVRSRRKASRSEAALTTAPKTITTTSTGIASNQLRGVADSAPNLPTRISDAITDESMNRSPWAKLMSPMIP